MPDPQLAATGNGEPPTGNEPLGGKREAGSGKREAGSGWLGSSLPARQITSLLVGERLAPAAASGEGVKGGGERAAPPPQPLGGQGLVGEGHVHHFGGMAFGGSEVDQPPLGDHMDPPPVVEGPFIQLLA